MADDTVVSSDGGAADGSGGDQAANAVGRGILDGFSGYLTPSEDDWRRLLTDGLVVIDTNVLLNLYRYDQEARADLISVLRKLDDRIWIPHQVAEEFWRNRESALEDPNQAAALAVKGLEEQRSSAVEPLRAWVNRVAFPADQAKSLERILSDAFDEVSGAIKGSYDSANIVAARDTDNDPVLAELGSLLSGKVGFPLDSATYKEAVTEGRRRIESQEPPGYKDKKKEASGGAAGAAGDYLVWFQLIKEAKRRKKDVLLVTGDLKEDWWRIRSGRPAGPRNELSEELLGKAGVRLFMLRPDRLMSYANKYLAAGVSTESLENVERVDARTNDTLLEGVGGWHLLTLTAVLSQLDSEAPVQARVIREAVASGGFVSRDRVYEIGNYKPGRMLKGFTRPVNRISQTYMTLLGDGTYELDLLSPVYDEMAAGFGRADGFAVPGPLLPLLQQVIEQGTDLDGEAE
ncbi:PIN-like domain-containing protein [Kitasatospora purpeofusca]|uniref:PIN-like domain-containing protein n=1 Tax=Kitasatospora purpeofusca TaxID=67352 RepID=UPI0036920BD4